MESTPVGNVHPAIGNPAGAPSALGRREIWENKARVSAGANSTRRKSGRFLVLTPLFVENLLIHLHKELVAAAEGNAGLGWGITFQDIPFCTYCILTLCK